MAITKILGKVFGDEKASVFWFNFERIIQILIYMWLQALDFKAHHLSYGVLSFQSTVKYVLVLQVGGIFRSLSYKILIGK